jgi:serine/threonine-protein kinase
MENPPPAPLFDPNAPTLPVKGSTPAIESENDKTAKDFTSMPTAAPDTVDPERPDLPVIPGYAILSELGRGGMGVVYKARQLNLGRVVALKMILGGAYAGSEALERFRNEASAVAQLQHPNIVHIWEVGDLSGRPYFSLEYVDGGSLSRKIAGVPMPPRQAAQMGETLARAMHHAHGHQIVHRDLKPANVLMTADGQPKITDFGLAKRMDGLSSGQTHSGAILGTPSYMAPEQALGKTKEASAVTDVYALGAILYEMLTGRPPFEGETALDTLQQVQKNDPVPPTRLQGNKIPRDLETICLKCLEKEPHKRYASAEALADDLRAFLVGDPIKARPAGAGERLAKWIKRRPTVAVLVAVAVMAALGLLVGAFVQNALAVVSVSVLGLLIAGWWYNARLQAALREAAQLHAVAERNVEKMHLLLETTHRLMSATDLDTLLRLISETTTRLANAERATVFLIDEERGELWSKVAMGEGVGEIRFGVGKGIAGTVAQTGETINIPDAYADPRFNRDVDRRTGYRTRNLITFPMKSQDGRVLGVFQVLNKREGAFVAEDAEALAALAASAAVAVENAQRFSRAHQA